jgi:hypothetical protein
VDNKEERGEPELRRAGLCRDRTWIESWKKRSREQRNARNGPFVCANG